MNGVFENTSSLVSLVITLHYITVPYLIVL